MLSAALIIVAGILAGLFVLTTNGLIFTKG